MYISMRIRKCIMKIPSQTRKRKSYRRRLVVSRQKRASDDSVYTLFSVQNLSSKTTQCSSNIKQDSQPLRDIISSPAFESYFGKAEPHLKGKRQNIFGAEDELKVAPKGVDKEHQDIDLLKCRSFAVVHRFMDSEVLDGGFGRAVAEVVEVMRPFVHCLNELMTV